MQHDLARVVAEYRSRGLLIDTNLLLLLLVGSHDRRLVTSFKRTNAYTPDDYELLWHFASKFDRLFTTPNILTEVSNLAGQVPAPATQPILHALAVLASRLDEEYVTSETAADFAGFSRFGLTDSVTTLSAQSVGVLVLTDDLPLYVELLRQGCAAINFNHLRQPA